ncbi:MAG: aspartate/glutamate racemase family protein [Firmicutes bacterium]|nr:aspartate/glutamate racemase family protein [Bacillota bacterium]
MLGVIGGMGPQATVYFLQGIIDQTDAGCDQEHIPMIILNHTTMPDRTAAILSGNKTEICEALLRDARMLEKNGCSAIVIPCNTSHYFVDEIQKGISIPIIHMARETINRVSETRPGIKKLAILATSGTIQSGVYHRECLKKGFEPCAPSPEKQLLLMDIIYREIKKKRPGSLSKFLEVEREIKAAGCEAAILACTELSCFARQVELPEYYIDAMDILIDKTVQFYGKGKKG